MAKITLTFEDAPGNAVKVISDPPAATLLKIEVSGAGLTSAQAYALFAINQIRSESKRQGKMKLTIPRIIRP